MESWKYHEENRKRRANTESQRVLVNRTRYSDWKMDKLSLLKVLREMSPSSKALPMLSFWPQWMNENLTIYLELLLVLNRWKHREASGHLINLRRGKQNKSRQISLGNAKGPFEVHNLKGSWLPQQWIQRRSFPRILEEAGAGQHLWTLMTGLRLTSRTDVQPEEKH